MGEYAPFEVKATPEIETQAHEEALKLALEARLVWPGLTALVTTTTTTTNSCLFEETSNNICPNDGIALKSKNENHFMQEDMIMGGTQSMSIKKTKIVWHSGGSSSAPPPPTSSAPPPPKITMGPLPSPPPPTQHPTFDLNETTLIDIHNDTLANNQTRFLKKEETVFLRQKQTKQESAPIFGSYQVFIPFLLFLLMLFS